MSDSFSGLQAILGTDKKNPMFAVYRDEQKRELHVYYGFELLEHTFRTYLNDSAS